MSVTVAKRFRERRTERGAVTILVALSMVALCLAGAFVLDLGLVRAERQQNKSAADAAAMAGANGLVPDLSNDVFHPFSGVCQALGYLKVNLPDMGGFASSGWSDGNGSPTGDGCGSGMAPLTCDTTTVNPATWARFEGTTADGRFKIRIQSGYDVTDGGFPSENLPALQADPGAARYKGCDQLAVVITELEDTSLGKLASPRVGSTIRSVARVDVQPPESPYALLILERTACDALAVASGGAGGRIDVAGYQNHPGMIHVDSAGGGSMCASKPVIEGKNPGTCPDPALPLAPTCGGVVAHESQTGGFPGRITAVATSNVSDGTPKVYAGPYPGTSPTYRGLVTRELLDKVYLRGVTNAVNNEARPAFAAAAAGNPGSLPGTWTTTGCTPSAAALGATQVFVNCANFNNDATFTDAQTIIFTGKVNAGNLAMPKALHVYVVGGSPNGMGVGTTFAMHDNSAPCPSTYATAAGRARLFLQNGAFKDTGNGSFRACNTTMVLMGGDSTGGACLPALSPYVPTYTNTPCPSGSAGNGSLDMSGTGTIDWTAPNKVDDQLQATTADHDDLEDLALWDETYDTQNVGGGGYMHLAGVFAAPNATPFKLNGGSTQDVRNSQYVVRQLWSTGNGTLAMQPLPSLPVAPPKVTFGLVR